MSFTEGTPIATTEGLGTAEGSMFASLQYRNFRLYFVGQGISQIGSWLKMLAQGLLVYELTESGVALGILVACQFLPVLVFGAWAGVVADRRDKRRLLIGVQTTAMAQSFALAALAIDDRPPIIAIYALALVGGVITAFDAPARRAFVGELVPERDVQNAVSLNNAIMTGSRIVGPALAGLLVVTLGYSWCFTVDAVSYVAVIYGLWRMRSDEIRRPAVMPRAKGQVREGLRYARSMPELWIPLTMTAIIGMLSFNFTVVMQLFVKETLGGTDTTFTWLLSILSIGSLVGALFAARRRTVSVHDVTVAALVFGIALFVMALAPNIWVAHALSIGVGVSSITFVTLSMTIVQLRAKPSMRGRVVALSSMVMMGATPVGGPIIGAVSQYMGARAGLVLGGIGAISGAAWGMAADPERRARRSLATEQRDGANAGAA